SALIGYVGTHSLHNVLQHDDSNIIFPDLSTGTPLWRCGNLPAPPGPNFDPTTCPLYPSPAHLAGINGPPTATNPGGLDLIAHNINCCVGREPTQLYNSNGIYHGLQVGVQKALGHGLSFQGSYTF